LKAESRTQLFSQRGFSRRRLYEATTKTRSGTGGLEGVGLEGPPQPWKSDVGNIISIIISIIISSIIGGIHR